MFGSTLFNLNFEQYSKETGFEHWTLFGDFQPILVDSQEKISGKHSLVITHSADKKLLPHTMVQQVIYAGFPRKQISLIGHVKYQPTSEDTQFSVIFTIFDGTEQSGETKFIEHKLLNATNWQEVTLSLPITTEVIYANIAITLTGGGQAWLDEFYFDFSK